MSGSSNPRKGLTELEGQIKKLKRQFGEQLVFLDSRTAAKQELISDLHEFFKTRAEIEATYAASLERLAERMGSKRSQTQKKEPTTTMELFNSLLNETRALGRERHAFSEKMSGEIGLRLDALNKDAQLIHRRVKEITQTCHDDLSRSYKDLVEVKLC
jgi:flagellar biosynthesis GTPase FlhF